MEILLQQLVNALSLGGNYALLALGLAVVFSIMRLINFAHGDIMTIAGYGMLFGLSTVSFPLAVLFACVLSISAAMLIERVAFRPVRNADTATMLLTSFAVSILLQVGFQNLISARPLTFQTPELLTGAIDIGVVISRAQAISITATLLILAGLVYFYRKTSIGIAMRAASSDFEVCRLMGVRANRVIAGAFAISGLLAAIAGIFWVSQRSSVDPLMGFLPVLKAFIAVILGGMGSLAGAVAGGFLLGFIEVFCRAILPSEYSAYRDALALAIVVLVLVVRPNGLLGAKGTLAR